MRCMESATQLRWHQMADFLSLSVQHKAMVRVLQCYASWARGKRTPPHFGDYVRPILQDCRTLLSEQVIRFGMYAIPSSVRLPNTPRRRDHQLISPPPPNDQTKAMLP